MYYEFGIKKKIASKQGRQLVRFAHWDAQQAARPFRLAFGSSGVPCLFFYPRFVAEAPSKIRQPLVNANARRQCLHQGEPHWIKEAAMTAELELARALLGIKHRVPPRVDWDKIYAEYLQRSRAEARAAATETVSAKGDRVVLTD